MNFHMYITEKFCFTERCNSLWFPVSWSCCKGVKQKLWEKKCQFIKKAESYTFISPNMKKSVHLSFFISHKDKYTKKKKTKSAIWSVWKLTSARFKQQQKNKNKCRTQLWRKSLILNCNESNFNQTICFLVSNLFISH